MKRTLLLLATSLVLAACQREPAAPAPEAAPARDTSGLARNAWALPTPEGAQPDLVIGPDGRLLLSWVRRLGDRNALQYAAYLGDDNWESAPKTIAVGHTLTANWADPPHIAMTEDGALWAHWLQTPANAASPHASDVMLTHSPDNGVHWSAPVMVNDDKTPTEHGFVSMWPVGQDAIGIAWLDGRRTAGAEHEHKHDAKTAAHDEHEEGQHAGTMTVRAARFAADLSRSEEAELDASTCDCCGTDAAITGNGALLAYRDRTQDEVRDIVVVRREAKGWSTPKPVHADGWKMSACPLNGPSVAAQGSNVAVAWYTAPNEHPVLRLARSADGGNTFDAPMDVDKGDALQGRVDVALDADAAWVVWLREDAKGQTVQLARYPAKGGAPQRAELARITGRGRATGFPKIALRRGMAYVVWTDLVEGRPQLAGMKVAPAETVTRAAQ
jgi:hypothetical protein